MRIFSKTILVFLGLLVLNFLVFAPAARAYEIEIDYYDDITKDAVTKVGIYRYVIIFLKTTPDIMEKINYVTYNFDESFYNPKIAVSSKHNAFQVEVKTLNHLPITAEVHFTNGKVTKLDKYLLLGNRRSPRPPAYNVIFGHVVKKAPDQAKGETDYDMDLIIEGAGKDLKEIDRVEYYFPEQFPKKLVKVSGVPDFKYSIKTSQQLEVQAYAYFKDGTVIEMVRFLYFKYY